MNKRAFSGIQPSGGLHIGNYFGAIRNWVDFQAKFECIFCIVDLHAITVPQDPETLRKNIRETAAILIAAGIDPRKSRIFVQSCIQEHAELAWILNCFIPMGWMQRMTQFKEKSQRERSEVNVGLFDYPALMAADILLYETDVVPVGEDQKQHVELTRDIAQRFNAMNGEFFKVPELLIPKNGARIMGLDDPEKKMSKSRSKWDHAIALLDSPDEIRLKIAKATTDSARTIRFDSGGPGIWNLLRIYKCFTGLKRNKIEERFEGKGYAEFKRELADVVIEGLRPLQAGYKELTAQPDSIDSLIEEGASAIRPIAKRTVTLVKARLGLGL